MTSASAEKSHDRHFRFQTYRQILIEKSETNIYLRFPALQNVSVHIEIVVINRLSHYELAIYTSAPEYSVSLLRTINITFGLHSQA